MVVAYVPPGPSVSGLPAGAPLSCAGQGHMPSAEAAAHASQPLAAQMMRRMQLVHCQGLSAINLPTSMCSVIICRMMSTQIRS